MDCFVTIDPTAVQHALDACFAVLRQPDSAANFLRGLMAVSVFGVLAIGAFTAVRQALR